MLKDIALLLVVVLMFSCNDDSSESEPEIDIITRLEAFYPFNGNAEDKINGREAEVNGPIPVNDILGNSNSAYYFDGIDDYIEIPFSEANIFSEFTVTT